MTAARIDGKAISAVVREEVAVRIAALKGRGVTAGLAVVIVGDDPASHVYVRNKHRAATQVGVTSFDHSLPADTSEASLLKLVQTLAGDDKVHGILVQLPLPAQINETRILDAIPPHKDVDGFHADNIGRLAQGRPRFIAATPSGCMRLIAEAGVDPTGKHAVVIGRSNIVGKPMAMLLTNAHATVTLCHSRTANLEEEVGRADIVVAAIGRERYVPGKWLKPGCTVIDVGMNRDSAGKLCGDVDYDSAAEVAAAITPVPGGVGPMTIATLLDNVATAAELSLS